MPYQKKGYNMDTIELWIDMLPRHYNGKTLEQMSIRDLSVEIIETEKTIENEKVFQAGGSKFAAENIENLKRYLRVLKEALEKAMEDKNLLDVIAAMHSLLVEVGSDETGFILEDEVDELFRYYKLTDEQISYVKGLDLNDEEDI
jgi:hypothetical protein